MKFTKSSDSKTKAEEKETSVTVEMQARELSVLQMRSDSLLIITDLMELLNQGSIFAQHCSLIHGIGGLEGVMILRSILTAVEIEANASPLDNMLQELKDSDASELQFLMIDYSESVRQAADATFKAYLRSFDSKPASKTSDKSSSKVGSISDLISAIEAALNLKGKK